MRQVLDYFLISLLGMLCIEVFGQTNTPPAPPVGNPPPVGSLASDSNRVARTLLDTNGVPRERPARPPLHIQFEDGKIYRLTEDQFRVYVTSPFYVIEHTDDLTLSNGWKMVGYSEGGAFIHDHPEGFYRAIKRKHPTPPSRGRNFNNPPAPGRTTGHFVGGKRK